MGTDEELLRRAEDLRERCERTSSLTHTAFLTPAEQYKLSRWVQGRAECTLIFGGGTVGCERAIAFFVPFWYDASNDPAPQCIGAVCAKAGFGEPGHRDYMGAALALGIKRESLGDIIVNGDTAYILCLDTVADTIVRELTHVGRCGVRCRAVPLEDIPPIVRRTRSVTFTVKSLRLDAVAAEMFGLSRTAAVSMIEAGLAQLNYEICEKPSAAVKPGDIISLRGRGKGELADEGGLSRKGRTFLTALVYE